MCKWCQLSHPYTTAGKTIALTRRKLVGKVMSLLFTMPSRLVITFLPRSQHLLISCLQSPSAVILEPRKINLATVSTVSPSICHHTRPPDLPLEKPVCRSGSNSQNWTWNNRLVPNRKRSTSRLYIVTLLS